MIKGFKRYNKSYSYSNNYYDGYYSNWGSSWRGSYYTLDDDDQLVFEEHKGYATPTKKEITSKLSKPSNNGVNLVKDFSRYFYYDLLRQKAKFKEEYLQDSLTEKQQETVAKYNHITEQLKSNPPYGHSPLQKALNLINAVDRQNKNGDSLLEALSKLAGDLDFNEDIWENEKLGDLIDYLSNILEEDNQMRRDFKVEKEEFKTQILNNMCLLKELGEEFKVQKEIKREIIPYSKYHANLKMKSYDQIPHIDLIERIMPNFNIKLATKNLFVKMPVKSKEVKQKIIMYIDKSGSMRGARYRWAFSILLDRLMYVIKEECELFVCFYNAQYQEAGFHHLYNEKTVKRFLSNKQEFKTGGSTMLHPYIEATVNSINTGRLLNLDIDLREEKVEMLVVTDGGDSYNTDSFNYKVNAITVENRVNHKLKNLCFMQKGKYIQIHNNRLVHYTKKDE